MRLYIFICLYLEL